MSHGAVLTLPTNPIGNFADEAISSLAPLVTFEGAAAEMSSQTPFPCLALTWGQPGAHLTHRERTLSQHRVI